MSPEEKAQRILQKFAALYPRPAGKGHRALHITGTPSSYVFSVWVEPHRDPVTLPIVLAFPTWEGAFEELHETLKKKLERLRS